MSSCREPWRIFTFVIQKEEKIFRILFLHPLKIWERYRVIRYCSYKSKALNRPRTIQQKK
ncbi:hypothetical protein D8M10_12920 [Lactococcus lactis subsp. lactis bv. diacetylactis]|uniref:Uncharacterized protein n=1 Tax=Lactococcus lactis subsp. lactis bv. diacetylactis TaxID=44688 RepID=A0A8B3ETS3_LACLL|nr:hypothetical protein [Lactococcus lactis]RKO29308.1 hypothetical protein D8M10_12815 [Lactococcus lactis subsp. lactis bv. diacetylactis]RKO29328.1 hypothetical protein D8M10_12920 [Lactococcus lactis subsp. lactis bv. diacetylactis]